MCFPHPRYAHRPSVTCCKNRHRLHHCPLPCHCLRAVLFHCDHLHRHADPSCASYRRHHRIPGRPFHLGPCLAILHCPFHHRHSCYRPSIAGPGLPRAASSPQCSASGRRASHPGRKCSAHREITKQIKAIGLVNVNKSKNCKFSSNGYLDPPFLPHIPLLTEFASTACADSDSLNVTKP